MVLQKDQLGDIVDIRPKNCKKSKLRFMCAVQQHLNNTL